jgi:hypothetical protein
MALAFQNASGQTAYMAVLWHDIGCGPVNRWRKMGWYIIPNRTSFYLFDYPLNRSYGLMAWYAEWWIDGPSWSGTGSGWYLISNRLFDQCYDDNNCNVQRNFQDLDLRGHYGLLVTLHAPGQAGQPGHYKVTPVLRPHGHGKPPGFL